MKYALSNCIDPPADEQLLNDMRKAAKRLRKNTVTIEQYQRRSRYHSWVIIKRFGTWSNAQKKAGLKPHKNAKVSTLDLIDNLQRLWDTLGRQPHLSDLHPPNSLFGEAAYIRVFGKWSNALKEFVKLIKSNRNKKGICAVATIIQHTNPRTRHISWRMRHIIMKRDHYRCKACGASPANDLSVILHVDHIKPISKGGQTIPKNLQTLCSVCNIGKSNL